MAEKAARNEGAKRAVAGEPKNRDRIMEYQCRRVPKVVIKLTSGDKRNSFLCFRNPKVVGQVRNPSKIGIVS